MSIKTIAFPAFLLASASTAFASDNMSYQYLLSHGLRVDGSVPTQITLSNQQKKIVRLMNITLSPFAAKKLAANVSHILNNPTQSFLKSGDLPSSINLGMNGLPVLDQGNWGTCATFATTGAIDAIYPILDQSQVSQLCNLELGVTLGNGGDGGWQGSFGYIVLGQINKYGYINFDYQHTTGCGGLKHYPTYSADNGKPMTVADFTANSITNFTSNEWTPIVSFNGNFEPIDPALGDKALTNVKTALNQGYRVVFGSLIDPNVGQVGAAGTYNKVPYDTWVMTKQMENDIATNQMMEGHEIIIDGYDDNACATYKENEASSNEPTAKKQCGLLRIRNSWSTLAGDQGDYYMSYDHFKGMVIEAYALGQDVKDKFIPIQ